MAEKYNIPSIFVKVLEQRVCDHGCGGGQVEIAMKMILRNTVGCSMAFGGNAHSQWTRRNWTQSVWLNSVISRMVLCHWSGCWSTGRLASNTGHWRS